MKHLNRYNRPKQELQGWWQSFGRKSFGRQELETDTRGILFGKRNPPAEHIIAVATDGAPAKVGCHRGFISHLKKTVPNVLSIHCVLHRQHLVARRLSRRLNESLQYVISAVNKIKSNPLNDTLRQLCDENNEEFNELLLHTEIRSFIERFFQLFDSVLQFFEEDDASLTENLRIRKADVAYLADLYFMFNEMNKQLLTEDLNLIKTKSVISAFMSKLLLFKRRFAMGELCQFQNLVEVKKEGQASDADVEVYCEHLQALHNDFASRFENILSVVTPDWSFGRKSFGRQAIWPTVIWSTGRLADRSYGRQVVSSTGRLADWSFDR
ncbi:hypothetical protein M513_09854 [Trichuris suis]|uniref:Uncharacterized protein n=1 Tax=Trichuris suis TaxID=68888 RepID=A0A085LWF6_9BILA|nr:hypothetical protein M513_09854 [Trichuris suis]